MHGVPVHFPLYRRSVEHGGKLIISWSVDKRSGGTLVTDLQKEQLSMDEYQRTQRGETVERVVESSK